MRCRAILLLIVLILSAKNIAKGWYNEEETPCFAVFCPVCDLLEKGEESFIRQNRLCVVERLSRFVRDNQTGLLFTQTRFYIELFFYLR